MVGDDIERADGSKPRRGWQWRCSKNAHGARCGPNARRLVRRFQAPIADHGLMDTLPELWGASHGFSVFLNIQNSRTGLKGLGVAEPLADGEVLEEALAEIGAEREWS